MATSVTRLQLREGAAKDLGLCINVSLGADTDVDLDAHTLTLPDLFTKFPDEWGLRDAFITYNGESYRRIIKYVDPATGTNKVMLDGNVAGIPTDPGDFPVSLTVYRLLSPEDWNNEINEALEALYRKMRVEVTIVSNQSDYPIDDQTDSEGDLCTYVQERTQIYDLQFQAQYNTNWNVAYGYGGVAYLQDNNSLTVRLTNMPLVVGNSQLILLVRKPYVWREHLLEADDDVTNCPYRLGMLQLQMNAIRLLFKRHGATMKAQFGAAAAVIERQLAEERHQWVPAMSPSSYTIDEPYNPDISPFEIMWAW